MSPSTVGALHASGVNNFHLIRLIAALAVIYGHAYAIVRGGGADLYLQLVGNKFIGGVAVDVFFVVSGFLIASSLERNTLSQYVWSRSLRIFPALLVAVGLSVFVLGPIVSRAPEYWSDPQTWNYLFSNAFMWRTAYSLPGVFENNPNSAVNGSLWSLPVEFRLYMVFFFLGALGLLQRNRFLAVTLVVFLGGLVAGPRIPWFTEYANWVNSAAFFFAGALVWTRRNELVVSAWGALGVLAACVAMKGTSGFNTAYFVALTYLVFVVAYAVKLPRIRARDLSYGIYLYGWPVQQLLVHFDPGMGAIANTALACLLAGLLAWASWEWVEKPMLALKRRSVLRASRGEDNKVKEASVDGNA